MQGYDKWERESLKDEEHPYESYNLTETSVIKYYLPDGRTNVESLRRAAETGENMDQTERGVRFRKRRRSAPGRNVRGKMWGSTSPVVFWEAVWIVWLTCSGRNMIK